MFRRLPNSIIRVVVCKYKHSSSLRETLASLAKMDAPADLPWQLILVDNNPKDSTRVVIEGFSRTSGLDVKYVFEAKRDLPHARNAGIAAAALRVCGCA